MGQVLTGLLAVLLLSGCQMTPTRVTETTRLQGALLNRLDSPIQIDEQTIVIDARPPFEYSMAHTPGAISMNWQDFADPSSGSEGGRSHPDNQFIAKRLALKGITPEKRILVVGNGREGRGEEGRIAWSLMRLGFSWVEIAKAQLFQAGMTTVEPEPRENAAEWVPQVRANFEAEQKEIMIAATSKINPKDRQKVFVLDVRTRKEYFLKKGVGESYVTPDLRAFHVPWTEFIDESGRPRREIRHQLQAMGWQLGDRILVISNHGVRSGLVAFALTTLGFTNVANYTGGYNELMGRNRAGPKLRPLGK